MTTLQAVGIQRAAWLLLAFPLAGAAILLLGGKRTNAWGHLLGVAMPVAAFGYGVLAFIAMLSYPAAQRSRDMNLFTWIDVGRFHVTIGLLLDPLSISFVLLITGVGSLIHIFAVGYMARDPERRRFFGYMNLFVAAMLLLVLADNYLGLYAGWEGVGLASYLLIGFWQFKPVAATAAKKAFIANRVGDAGLSIAIMLMFATFGTVTFTGVFGAAGAAIPTTLTALGLPLLLGHGFFKAGLFLGAGAVKHEMNDEVDMRRFGGLAKIMPITTVTFFLGYLAIIGIPPFSGFFTKDSIIDAAFDKGGTSGFILGCATVLGAAITAFYMSRVMFMTFVGERRWEADAHPHEAPPVMTAPMIVLAIGSVGAGAFLIVNDKLADFLAPVVGRPPAFHGLLSVPGLATLALALIGTAIAWARYGRQEIPVISPAGGLVTVAARKDLYGDAVNESVLMRPGQWLTRLSVYFDNRGIDGLVNTLAATMGGTSGRLRRLQTGFVRSYALSMLVGAVLLVGALLLVKI